jgi:two-component system response regulator AtoC
MGATGFYVGGVRMAQRILIIDDDESMCELLELELGRHGLDVTCATTSTDALAVFDEQEFDAVLTDVRMSGQSGVELCAEMVGRREDVPVVVATAYADTETAVAAIRAGAYDFVTKPFDIDDLLLTIERAVRHRALRQEVKRLRQAVGDAPRFDDILGESPAMIATRDLVARLGETETTALITGESGTGKELVAKALHAGSLRRSGPFVAVNCAAMPEALLESELFGHVKGAFTDARASRQGLFVKARGGTIFLDEIAEMPQGMQVKLLRVLQERTVRPVGGDEEQTFDARIVAATNREIELEVEQRRFREDLFYRINVVRIHVPPLRARGSDVLLLARGFIARYAAQSGRPVVGLTGAVAEKLVSYPWPGNVRELQNCIERAVALARLDHLGVEDLPERVRDYRRAPVEIESSNPTELPSMEEVENRYIARVITAVGGNKTLAAQVLGFDRRTLYRKLERVREPQRTSSGTQLRAITESDLRKGGNGR